MWKRWMDYLVNNARGKGNTTALLGLLHQIPNLRMVVSRQSTGDQLASRTGLGKNRFISVSNVSAMMGADFPVVFDHPAIVNMLNEAFMDGKDIGAVEERKRRDADDFHKAMLKSFDEIINSIYAEPPICNRPLCATGGYQCSYCEKGGASMRCCK